MKKKLMIQWMTAGHISIPKLLLTSYRDLGLNEEELVTIIHIHTFIEEGFGFPTPEDITKRMTISLGQCIAILQQLLKKGCLELKEIEDSNGALAESYSLEPLWEQLLLHLYTKEENQKQANKEEEELNLYSLFEREFSRPLSPMECETLAMWIDKDNYSTTLIYAALREAVVAGKLNLRYIDRILFEWSKNGVTTVEQARAYGEKFRKHQLQQTRSSQTRVTQEAFPSYNWLEK